MLVKEMQNLNLLKFRKDEEGYTPLHLAVIAGNKPVIRFLLD